MGVLPCAEGEKRSSLRTATAAAHGVWTCRGSAVSQCLSEDFEEGSTMLTLFVCMKD